VPTCFEQFGAKLGGKTPGSLRLRQAIALPFYTVALILSHASDALGDLAALIAGDD
jgi:hypothetical protein